MAIELRDGTIVSGGTSELLGAASSALINALKVLAGIDKEVKLIDPKAIDPIQDLKINYLGSKNPRLHTDEVLTALSATAANNEIAMKAMKKLPLLKAMHIQQFYFHQLMSRFLKSWESSLPANRNMKKMKECIIRINV